jgi:hypothetical protein
MCVAARAVGRERRERRGRAARTPRFASRHPLHARPCTVPRPAAAAARRGGRPMRAARGAAPAAQRRPPPSPPLPRPGRALGPARRGRVVAAAPSAPGAPDDPTTTPDAAGAELRAAQATDDGATWPLEDIQVWGEGVGGAGSNPAAARAADPPRFPLPRPASCSASSTPQCSPRWAASRTPWGRSCGCRRTWGGRRVAIVGKRKESCVTSAFRTLFLRPSPTPLPPQLPPALARCHRGRALGGGHRVPVRRGDRAAGFG